MVCSQCQFTTLAINALKAHMIQTHKMGDLFQCYKCDKKYASRGSLNLHERKHIIFKCTQCEYKAINQTLLS